MGGGGGGAVRGRGTVNGKLSKVVNGGEPQFGVLSALNLLSLLMQTQTQNVCSQPLMSLKQRHETIYHTHTVESLQDGH